MKKLPQKWISRMMVVNDSFFMLIFGKITEKKRKT